MRFGSLTMLVWLVAFPAAAQGSGLEWVAPEGCPGAEAIRDQIAQLTSHNAGDLGVRAEVTRVEQGFRLSLQSPAGERALTAETCAAAAEATALIVALLLDPDLPDVQVPAPAAASDASAPVEEAPADAPGEPRGLAADPLFLAEPPPARAAGPAPAPSNRSATDAPADAPAGPRAGLETSFALRGGVVGDLGVLPAPGVGPAVAAGVGVGWATFAVGAFGLAPRSGRVTGHDSARADVWLAAATFSFGARFGRAVSVEPSVGLELGAVGARGRGVTDPGRAHTRWTALRADLSLGVPVLDRASVALSVGLVRPTTRPTFVLTGVGDAHRPAPLSARLGLDARVHFG